MNAEGNTIVTPSPWIASQRWDLSWLSLSALLVVVPPLAHVHWRVGATGVDLLVTLLIGGPHMYATFLRTVFEPRFRLRHPLAAWGPVIAVPLGVVLLSAFAFEALLSLFFVWASLHICDQASYIGQLYRRKDGVPTLLDKGLDFLAVMVSLYTVAMYRFVDGTFVIGGHSIFFPPFLRFAAFPRLFAFFSAIVLATWGVRSLNQLRRGELRRGYFTFMLLTIGVSFAVPLFGELSVSFQGFNAWHSFQYLGLTSLALGRREKLGEVTLGFVRQMAKPGEFLRYYGWNVLWTLAAGVIVAVLVYLLGLPLEQCYYTVVLSVLLVHYCHDSVLFSSRSESNLQAAPAGSPRESNLATAS